MNTMLYRHPGPHAIHGDKFDYLIVDDAKIGEALNDGWHLSTPEALAASRPKDDAPPTRAELEQKATELGLKFDGRWGDKRLSDAIAAKLG